MPPPIELTDSGGVDGARDEDASGADAAPSDAPPPDRVCVSVESAAVEIRRPIDAIVLPDESA